LLTNIRFGEKKLHVTVVAEIGSNWEGSITKAKNLISEIKSTGADAVKFQMWRAKDLYDESNPEWKNIQKSELTFDIAKQLKKFSDNIGIEFFCSAFYPEAIEFLETLHVKRYKIASRTSAFKDLDSIPTLQKISKTKKPVIMSLGLGGNRKKLSSILLKNKSTLCYCIAEYPLEFNKIKWNEAIKYDGFSDHTMGITAPLIFTVLKNQIKSKNIVIEKHVKLKNSKGPDASTSITTEQLSEMISHIRLIQNANFSFKI